MSAEILGLYSEAPKPYDPLRDLSSQEKEQLFFDSLMQGTTLAGREKPFTRELDTITSEGALHRYRAQVEIEALINFAEHGPIRGIAISGDDKQVLRDLYNENSFDARAVIRLDHIGVGDDPKPLEHDVKAVEVHLAGRLDEVGLGHLKEWVHFGMTSEDTNNLAYNLMLRDATNKVLIPSVIRVADRLAYLAATYADTPTLGVTHAQKASPTTAGKQFGYLLANTTEVLRVLEDLQLTGKFSGAVGNHNPMTVLFPEFDYDSYAQSFVESFGFDYASVQNQRNNHITVATFLDVVTNLAVLGKDATDNIWLKILGNQLSQRLVAGEKGSSTMSHKINPWRLENAESLFEQAIGLISRAKEGLVASRHERDLSDHGWERAYGDMVGRVVAGFSYFAVQLDRLAVDESAVHSVLQGSAEVLSELVQTAGRVSGDPDAYDRVVELTQGKRLDQTGIHQVVDQALPDGPLKDRVMAVTPDTYIGVAGAKARESVLGWHACKTVLQHGALDWRHGIDALLFDLDDTLVMGDKQELAARMWAIKEDLQADITAEDFAAILQVNGWSATIQQFLLSHNQNHPDQVLTIDQFNQSNRDISGSFDHLLTLDEDVHVLLDNLDRKGKKKAIVTQRGPNSLPRVLELFDLTHRFDATVHGTEAKQGKPYPEAWILGLGKLGVLAERAMVVGDLQSNDILPAKGMGAMAVLVKDGSLDPFGAKPDMQVRNLRELALKFER